MDCFSSVSDSDLDSLFNVRRECDYKIMDITTQCDLVPFDKLLSDELHQIYELQDGPEWIYIDVSNLVHLNLVRLYFLGIPTILGRRGKISWHVSWHSMVDFKDIKLAHFFIANVGKKITQDGDGPECVY